MTQKNTQGFGAGSSNVFLMEAAWEVCNQVGGIYTVIRSKVPSMMEKWGENYYLMGPYINKNVAAVFDETELDDSPFCRTIQKMRNLGMEVHYGNWLVTGRPKTILFNPHSVFNKLGEIKYMAWQDLGIPSPSNEALINDVMCFNYMMQSFLHLFAEETHFFENNKVITHFHEWMAALPIPYVKRSNLPFKTVFTTHATMLGRYLAMNDPDFYNHLPFFDWAKETKYFNIETQVYIERAAAQSCHVFTTVSQVTGAECKYLLGREPDIVLPNGLNIKRFTAMHEFQILHQQYKEEIHKFVMGHFFQSYSFDLDNTLYFFTSGRYEYRNKGYDITLEALARLNWRLKQEKIDTTVVMFIVTKLPYHSINPLVLESRAMMEEIRHNCKEIQRQVGDRLFYSAAVTDGTKMPDLNQFVDDYWRLRLRRTIQSWKSPHLPSVVTHNLVNDDKDDVLNFLRNSNLVNRPEDRVKIVYHPDFITTTNPLFGIEYGQFVRGCHLGVFPSYYEPWGYTPLECIASGVPALTSDLAGFGDYIVQSMPDHEKRGIYVVNRRNKDYDISANQLAAYMYSFVKLSRRERIGLRNRVEGSSEYFDWQRLRVHYDNAHNLATQH